VFWGVLMLIEPLKYLWIRIGALGDVFSARHNAFIKLIVSLDVQLIFTNAIKHGFSDGAWLHALLPSQRQIGLAGLLAEGSVRLAPHFLTPLDGFGHCRRYWFE